LRWKHVFDGLILIALALAPYYLSAFNLSLLGRFLALAILSLGLVLVWGWGGILSLGQGIFFGLGAYVLAMHMTLVSIGPGGLPDFMMWSGLENVPAWWSIFHNPAVTLASVVLMPLAAAALLGWLMFHRRVGGVYFALITQALALAFSTLLISEQAYTGGFNGLTNFTTILGYSVDGPNFERGLYWVTLGFLTLSFILCQWLRRTNFGKVLVAIRDGENRVRFLGYNAMAYKTVAFAVGGALAGIAGALYMLHLGDISPAMVGVIPSIEMVVAVAVGGRESLTGVILGTLLVNFGKDWISNAMPQLWLFVMGALFVLVVTGMRGGLASLPQVFSRMLHRPHKRVSGANAAPASEGGNPAPAVEEEAGTQKAV
jgi:urea transport system permease protein